MRRFKVGDSNKTSGRRVRGWLSCFALLGMFSLSGCDVNVEDDPDADIEVDDDPDLEVDADPDIDVDTN